MDNDSVFLPDSCRSERKSRRWGVNTLIVIVLLLFLSNDAGGHIVLTYNLSGGIVNFCFDMTIMDTGWTMVQLCDGYSNRSSSSTIATCHLPSRETQHLRTLVNDFAPTGVHFGHVFVPDGISGLGMFYGSGNQPLDAEAEDFFDRIPYLVLGECVFQ